MCWSESTFASLEIFTSMVSSCTAFPVLNQCSWGSLFRLVDLHCTCLWNCVWERGLSFISHSLSRRFWGIASTFWRPDLLNSGKSLALAFPCLNSVLPFREQIAVALSPCHRGRVHVHSRNWDHGSHLRAELDLDLKLHTHAIFWCLFLCFLRHRSKLVSPFLGDFMVTVCLVVRVLGSCQKLQKRWGTHHHELTSELCKQYLAADYESAPHSVLS